MQTSLSFNKSIEVPQMLFGSDNINNFGNRVKSCRMEDDSVQPTIEPCEVVVFANCGGRVLTPGTYAFTSDVLGCGCLFIKRIEPLPNDALKIISSNLYYRTFMLNASEQKDMRIHGRVVASLAVRHFI